MGAYKSVPLVPDTAISCEEFGPGMFVSLLINIENKGEFEVKLGNDQDQLLKVLPDYNKPCLVLKSQIAGKTHKETPSSVQLDKGGGWLQLTISADANSFDIFINKVKYYSYQYREDVRKVRTAQFTGNGTMAAMSMGRTLLGLNYTTVRAVYIQARAPKEDKFAIDFVSSYQPNYITDNIPFHMSVRFNDKEVVRNAKISETWKEEERGSGFPFKAGEEFSVVVFAQKGAFEVAVNQEHFTKFKYRMQFEGDLCVQLRNVPHIKKIAYHCH